jgi:hypothetical protein
MHSLGMEHKKGALTPSNGVPSGRGSHRAPENKSMLIFDFPGFALARTHAIHCMAALPPDSRHFLTMQGAKADAQFRSNAAGAAQFNHSEIILRTLSIGVRGFVT